MEIEYNMYSISLAKISWNCFVLLLTSTKKKKKRAKQGHSCKQKRKQKVWQLSGDLFINMNEHL